jgi:hypothetical protein
MPRALHSTLKNFGAPAALYALLFYALTYPLLHSFNTHFFCGQEDGYQNIWNLWWLNKSVGELHQLPWYTTHLHHPAGTSLLAHTLAPLNALFAVPMLRAGLALHHVYNTIVVFSFVMTGVTTFWLARRVTGSYAGALFAGAAYTFGHFHFAHAQNHLQLVALQWLPLAVLAIYELLVRPIAWKGVAAAAALLLVALTDFHLTFYAILAGVVLGGFVLVRLLRRDFDGARRYRLPVALFLLLSAGTTGVLAWNLLALNRHDPLQQNHDPKEWSTDLIDLAVPGAQWRFNALTKPVWSTLAPPDKPFVYVEHSLYPGWVIVALCVYAFRHRHDDVVKPGQSVGSNATKAPPRILPPPPMSLENPTFWFTLLTLVLILSLGPKLHVAGFITPIPGVYRALEFLFPPLKVAGVPMRMMALVLLVASVIAASAIGRLLHEGSGSSLGLRSRRGGIIVALVLLAWLFEILPKPQPITPIGYPQWVRVLHDLPPGPVLDTTYKTDMSRHLYYATGHGHPVGEGYISRYPLSVERARGHLRQLVDERRFDELRDELGFCYLVTDAPLPFRALFQDPGGKTIYDLTAR